MCADPNRLEIATERLRLRPPRLDDAVYLADLANDAEVARMTAGVPHPYRLADAEAFVVHARTGDPDRERPILIEHRQFGPIGMCGFHLRGRIPELGYWMGRTFRGRGLATEAVTAAVAWAQAGVSRGGWGKRAILSSHFGDNPASARVLDKAGFLYTGEVQRHFSLGRGQAVDARMMLRLA